MKYLTQMTTGRVTRLLGACALLAGGAGAAGLLTAGTASAAACGTATEAGTSCTTGGSADLTGGLLTLTAPATLSWGTVLNGADQELVDTTTADQTLGVVDATGTGAGWNISASATQFTTGGDTPLTLAAATTLSINGAAAGVQTDTTAPDGSCLAGSTCVVPTNALAGDYPIAITTTAAPIFEAALGTGEGSIVIGAVDPVGWWVNVPADTAAGTYTSTITLELATGP
jgi:hypothetical protein